MEQTLVWSATREGEERAVQQGVCKLPPLILHPFTSEKGPDRLLEGSRAQLILNGAFPEAEQDREKLMDSLLAGKYQELKMLIYIGRDLRRWAEHIHSPVRKGRTGCWKGRALSSFLMEHSRRRNRTGKN